MVENLKARAALLLKLAKQSEIYLWEKLSQRKVGEAVTLNPTQQAKSERRERSARGGGRLREAKRNEQRGSRENKCPRRCSKYRA